MLTPQEEIKMIIAKQTAYPSLSPTVLSKTPDEIAYLRSRSRWLACLFLSGTFGLLSAIFGLGLSALLLAGVVPKESANPEITVLLGAAFPLLFLSAHSLDKIREAEKRVKLEYCKRLGGMRSGDRSTGSK